MESLSFFIGSIMGAIIFYAGFYVGMHSKE
jgi:hypothetical protein